MAAQGAVNVDTTADRRLQCLDLQVIPLADTQFRYAAGVVGQQIRKMLIHVRQCQDNLLVADAIGALRKVTRPGDLFTQMDFMPRGIRPMNVSRHILEGDFGEDGGIVFLFLADFQLCGPVD